MPTTRKKVIKTVYKDDESEDDGDFSDSGSDAKISAEEESSSEEEIDAAPSSSDEFDNSKSKKNSKPAAAKAVRRKPKFAKDLIRKIIKQSSDENVDVAPALFSVKDLTEADKLLPSILNLSESDSSDDEAPRISNKKQVTTSHQQTDKDESDNENKMEYQDVWSSNIQDDSEEIAKKTFLELEKHKTRIEETKMSVQNYTQKMNMEKESDVKDLLAMGEEVLPTETETVQVKKKKTKKQKDDSDSEMEDWEEVKDSKPASQQGIQLFVEFPDAQARKSKTVDVEMMMKRKINRVKKEYQVYMHKVHVLCWLGHGNYVSRVLNDQELMAAALSLVPSKECYPGQRVDMKYVEQITSWYKDKLTLNQDKHEDKFKPKQQPLKALLLGQMQKRVVTTKKYLVFIFVTMLRALGLQCRIMFNFVTLPIKPPSSELCSLSTKAKEEKAKSDKSKQPTDKTEVKKEVKPKEKTTGASSSKTKQLIVPQLDGNYDGFYSDDDENIMQVDGSDDPAPSRTRSTRTCKRTKATENEKEDEEVSPPKIPKKSVGTASPKPTKKQEDSKVERATRTRKGKETESETVKEKTVKKEINKLDKGNTEKPPKLTTRKQKANAETSNLSIKKEISPLKKPSISSTRSSNRNQVSVSATKGDSKSKTSVPSIAMTDENDKEVSSKFFEDTSAKKKPRLSRQRSQTTNPQSAATQSKLEVKENVSKAKTRTKSAPGTAVEKSKYFEKEPPKKVTPRKTAKQIKDEIKAENSQRVSHRDLAKAQKGKNDVKNDLVDIIKTRIKVAKTAAKQGIVKGKIKKESDEDSDFLPEEDPKGESDDDFKPTKISPGKIKPGTSKRIDRRVLSSVSEESPRSKNKIDVWCEIFVEELEQWISVDVIKGKVHSTADLYNHATHPVCYVVGWDNNNYLKDLTRKYVPHWNTQTRKIRAEAPWWDKAIHPWLGPKTARDREEDEFLDKMQLEAPLPTSVGEYKNHPLYALKRHLLKFEAIYPPDAAVLGFVRKEPVYARECVYVCRSRDIWLKEAKTVKLGEKPYKIVKARPKWDRLSNKLVTDKLLEIFGPWQVQDYEPPTAENGIVPRNEYGNVELFKECMLPKGTVHLKLPSLNRVAKKLGIDCAPAMTGFDYHGGWSHPVFDGFVVCKEFEETVTEAWVKDQEEQERRETEKMEARVYGNWKRLIKGLIIGERLKCKYGFEKINSSEPPKKSTGPRLVVKKKS
ncbi:unnamed protein product [Chrysodeixis includens]|uniref:DNA repair protein complementing XP-C cells homolog n=1 Tax=Chrysodeixis includens TaxID=689277 RepID=A0A9N8KU62_CHRIL|nr:unnamed protein product [Chrysodeixis includens]